MKKVKTGCFKSLFLVFGLALSVGAMADNTQLKNAPSAATDHSDRLFLQAIQFDHAEGVPQDTEKAYTLYCQAANLGSVDALYALGWMHANERGVVKDDKIAAQLFTLAAEQGHIHAQQMKQYIATSSDSTLPDCLQSAADTYEMDSAIDYSNNSIFHLVNKLAPHYDVDPYLVMAVIAVESGFNAQAVSPKNAQGLMQLIPETAERFQVNDIFDLEDNIKGGTAYLQWLLAFFKGDVTLAVAAYNAGEGAVERHKGIPPYPETVDYVQKIQQRYSRLTHPYQADIVHRHALITHDESESSHTQKQ